MTTAVTDPVFVVGYMHSGTTLLLNVLSNHPDVFTPRTETKFFMHMGIVRKLLGPLRTEADIRRATAFCRYVIEHGFPIGVDGAPWEGQPEIGGIEGLRPPLEHGELLRRVLDDHAHQAGKPRWVEKTPTHVFNAEEIVAAIPDARFVEIVRDCRDVLASKKTRREAVWTDRYPAGVRYRRHLEKAYDPLWDSLSWRSAIRAGRRGLHRWPERWLRLRYEDFVREPEAAAREICRFAELPFSADLLDVSRGIPADISRVAEEGPGVSASSVGRWHTTLAPHEAALSETICGRELRNLGYPTQRSGVGSTRLVAHMLGRSFPELVLRVSRRFRLGGVGYGRDVLNGYARRLRALVDSRSSRR